MPKLRVTRSNAVIKKHGAKWYLAKYIPWIALVLSILANLKAYNVIS